MIDNYRLQKIESTIAKTLSEMLVMHTVRDPRINPLVTVSYAKISSDLRSGVIGISGYMSKTALRKSIAGLNSAAGFLQSHLAKQIRMRTIPRLRFVEDTSLKRGFETVQKIGFHNRSAEQAADIAGTSSNR